jgi:hypothetical protein
MYYFFLFQWQIQPLSHLRRHNEETEQTLSWHSSDDPAMVLAHRHTLCKIILVVGEESLNIAGLGQSSVLKSDDLSLSSVVDDLDSDGAVSVGESGGVQGAGGVAAGDGGADAVGALLDEAGAEVGECPETLGGLHDIGGGVDVDEHFVVGVVGCAPPVSELLLVIVRLNDVEAWMMRHTP